MFTRLGNEIVLCKAPVKSPQRNIIISVLLDHVVVRLADNTDYVKTYCNNQSCATCYAKQSCDVLH